MNTLPGAPDDKRERVIGDNTFTVTLFGADKAIDIGEPLFDIMAATISSLDEGLRSAAEALIKNKHSIMIDDEKIPLSKYIAMLLQFTKIDGHRMEGQYLWTQFFKGRLSLLLDVVTFVLEVNYADFLPKLQTLLTLIMSQVGMQFESAEKSEQKSDNSKSPDASNQPDIDG